MIPQIVTARELRPGDVVMWDSEQRFVESVDKTFPGAVVVKLHNLFLAMHWPPAQQLIKFAGLPLEESTQ